MKKFAVLLLAALTLTWFAGCGQEQADRPLEEVRAEAQKLDAAQLEKAIATCKKELAALEPKIEDLKKQIEGLKLTELASEKSKELVSNLEQLRGKIDNLGEQIEIYTEAAKAKAEAK